MVSALFVIQSKFLITSLVYLKPALNMVICRDYLRFCWATGLQPNTSLNSINFLMLSFFNGKHFVPFVVILRSAIAAILLSAFWPRSNKYQQLRIWIANSRNTSVLAPFLFGTFGTFVLPFGLHHVDYPNEPSALGGTYDILTGAAKALKYLDRIPGLAWVIDLDNPKVLMLANAKHVRYSSSARFKVGQMIGSFGILMGVAAILP